uniref:Uncharacterized protein n=1 Tax=Lactuca sativa TaxID=4236 RepID=A0A9R1UHZ6_LACSA|nr:hypothetical protein LSAT_V11C900461800 [Lactuca sativa]
MAIWRVLKPMKELGLKVRNPRFRLKEGYLIWDVPGQYMLKNATEMYNLYNLEKERIEKEDVLGVLGEVHNVLQVSDEKVTPDVLVEGESKVSCFSEASQSESSVSNGESQSKSPEIVKVKKFCSIGTQTKDFSCSNDVVEGMVPYRKLIIQDVQIYQTPKVYVPKACDVQILKYNEDVQVPQACEKVQKVEVKHVQRNFNTNFSLVKDIRSWRKEKRVLVGLMKFLKIFVVQLKSRYYFQKMIDFLQINECARNQLQS